MANCGCPTNSSPTTSSSVLVASSRPSSIYIPKVTYDRKTCKPYPHTLNRRPISKKRNPDCIRWKFKAKNWYSSIEPTELDDRPPATKNGRNPEVTYDARALGPKPRGKSGRATARLGGYRDRTPTGCYGYVPNSGTCAHGCIG